MVVFVGLRTGEMFHASTAGFAIMTAAILSQDDPPPQVAGELEKFFREWHRLVEICQEAAKRLFCHTLSLFHYSKTYLKR